MSILDKKKTGCIGTGNIGTAILSSLAKETSKENLYCYDTDKARMEALSADLGIKAAASPEDLAQNCNVIILAVKPDVIRTVLQAVRNSVRQKIIISVAAGISTSLIKKEIAPSSASVIRVMPNTPALIREGMTVISPADEKDEESLKIAEEIFSAMGAVITLPEKHMDAVTAVSGSGPAYGFTVIQAMADGGVKMGLPRDKAVVLAAQTILGAAKMVLESNDDPITLRGKVTSPGGTTIEAVHILEKAGFSGILMDAIEAATVKSEKLGK